MIVLINHFKKYLLLFVILWFTILSAIIYILYKFFNEKFTKSIFIFFILVLFFYVFQISKNLISERMFKVDSDIFFSDTIKNIKFKKSPNIYFLISDMFADNEYLRKLYPKFNNELINFLQIKNFKVKENNLSNYPSTTLSVMSILNGSYLEEEFFFKNQKSLPEFSSVLKSYNKIDKIFKNNDYTTNYIFCWGDYVLKKKYFVNKNNISYLDSLDISFLNAVMHHTFLRGYFNNVTKKNEVKKKEYLSNYYEIIDFKISSQALIIFIYIFHTLHIYLMRIVISETFPKMNLL